MRWRIERVKSGSRDFAKVIFTFSIGKRPVQPKKFEEEEMEQLLEENPTQREKELAHALWITQQEIFHRMHRLGRIQEAGRWPKAPN